MNTHHLKLLQDAIRETMKLLAWTGDLHPTDEKRFSDMTLIHYQLERQIEKLNEVTI